MMKILFEIIIKNVLGENNFMDFKLGKLFESKHLEEILPADGVSREY